MTYMHIVMCEYACSSFSCANDYAPKASATLCTRDSTNEGQGNCVEKCCDAIPLKSCDAAYATANMFCRDTGLMYVYIETDHVSD